MIFLPLGLGLLEFLDAQAVDFGEDEIQVFHALEAAVLAQVDVSVKLAQDLQQPLMGLQVQVQFFPHFIIGGGINSPFDILSFNFDLPFPGEPPPVFESGRYRCWSNRFQFLEKEGHECFGHVGLPYMIRRYSCGRRSI